MLRTKPLLLATATLLSPATPVRAQQQQDRPIETLLQEGWEVMNFTAVQERRTVILFRHKDRKYLMQCSVLVDVMRSPRVATACYELR